MDDRDRYHWTREELFVGGGLTLLELLETIPGATGFRSRMGRVADPCDLVRRWGSRSHSSHDGFEIAPFDDRTGGLVELGEIQLWTLEEVLVEPGPDELRVYLRSWRVDRTTTASRTDILTGDDDTNYYRGFLGRRFRHGEALQAGFQQYGTIGAAGGGGDELSLIARLGWVTRHVSIDAFGIRARRQRNLQTRDDGDEIPQLNSIRRDAYARIAVGDPDRGGWAQVVLRWARTSPGSAPTRIAFQPKVSLNQLVGAVGWSMSAFRASLTSRTFSGDDGPQSVTGRVSLANRWRRRACSPSGVTVIRRRSARWRRGEPVFVPEQRAASLRSAVDRPMPMARTCEPARRARTRIGQRWFMGGGVILDSIHVPRSRSSTRRFSDTTRLEHERCSAA